MVLNNNQHLLGRLSLSFLWIFTGLTSLFFNPETGYEILHSANITGDYAVFLIYAGSLVDILIGIWLLQSRLLKVCYLIQICIIVVYMLLLSFIDFSYWLHPFGPVTKNIPILVLIFILFKNDKSGGTGRI